MPLSFDVRHEIIMALTLHVCLIIFIRLSLLICKQKANVNSENHLDSAYNHLDSVVSERFCLRRRHCRDRRGLTESLTGPLNRVRQALSRHRDNGPRGRRGGAVVAGP